MPKLTRSKLREKQNPILFNYLRRETTLSQPELSPDATNSKTGLLKLNDQCLGHVIMLACFENGRFSKRLYRKVQKICVQIKNMMPSVSFPAVGIGDVVRKRFYSKAFFGKRMSVPATLAHGTTFSKHDLFTTADPMIMERAKRVAVTNQLLDLEASFEAYENITRQNLYPLPSYLDAIFSNGDGLRNAFNNGNWRAKKVYCCKILSDFVHFGKTEELKEKFLTEIENIEFAHLLHHLTVLDVKKDGGFFYAIKEELFKRLRAAYQVEGEILYDQNGKLHEILAVVAFVLRGGNGNSNTASRMYESKEQLDVVLGEMLKDQIFSDRFLPVIKLMKLDRFYLCNDADTRKCYWLMPQFAIQNRLDEQFVRGRFLMFYTMVRDEAVEFDKDFFLLPKELLALEKDPELRQLIKICYRSVDANFGTEQLAFFIEKLVESSMRDYHTHVFSELDPSTEFAGFELDIFSPIEEGKFDLEIHTIKNEKIPYEELKEGICVCQNSGHTFDEKNRKRVESIGLLIYQNIMRFPAEFFGGSVNLDEMRNWLEKGLFAAFESQMSVMARTLLNDYSPTVRNYKESARCFRLQVINFVTKELFKSAPKWLLLELADLPTQRPLSASLRSTQSVVY